MTRTDNKYLPSEWRQAHGCQREAKRLVNLNGGKKKTKRVKPKISGKEVRGYSVVGDLVSRKSEKKDNMHY